MALGATNRMSSDASSEMSDPISNEQNSTRPGMLSLFDVKVASTDPASFTKFVPLANVDSKQILEAGFHMPLYERLVKQ